MERILDRTKDNSPLSFTVRSPQLWHDDGRKRDRIMRYMGRCYSCGRRTYAFDDGENDPRGVLGDHAADPIYPPEHFSDDERVEMERVGATKEIPACFMCTNDYDRYKYLLDVGVRRARKKGANV